MQSFYEFVLTFRGEKKQTNEGKLAEWIFQDIGYPKHTNNYHEISDYLEWNSPFPEALQVFDSLWESYIVRPNEQDSF